MAEAYRQGERHHRLVKATELEPRLLVLDRTTVPVGYASLTSFTSWPRIARSCS